MTRCGSGETVSHRRIKAQFFALLELPDPEARQAAIAASDLTASERAELLELLTADDRTTRIAAPIAQAAAQWLGHVFQPGEQLGAWRLVRPLGEGGMGRVFLAERADGAYAQRAAIKLLRLGLGDMAVERFTRERQILAGLDHPNIARLLDGGQSPQGWPYLVMEYVQGEPIDQWCQRHAVGLSGRLALLRSLCEAIAYAHRNLVIHCDLKPSNVLVDGDGRLRLLDFGIAHVEGQAEDGALGHTPGYASPEQVAGQSPTVASDVYAMGRLLERLCAPIAGARRQELLAIVDKATAMRPEERYGDIGSLLQELQRLETHHPVNAMGPRRLYVARKLLRRRWPWALTLSVALCAAGAFTWRLTTERDRALAAERRAQQQAEAAQAISGFLTDLFVDADSWHTQKGRTMPATALIDRGEKRVRESLLDQPQIRAPLLHTLARVRENVGHSENAARLYEEAVQTYHQLGVLEPLPALYNALVFTYNRLGRYRAAMRAIEAWEALGIPEGSDDRSILDNAMGTVLPQLGRVEEGRARLLRSLEARGELPSQLPGPPRSLRGYLLTSNLALAELAAGRGAEAEALSRRVLLPEDATAFRRYSVLAMALMLQGRSAEALEEFERADRAAQRDFGEFSGNRHRVLREHGWALLQAGRAQEAIRTLRLALRCAEEGEAASPAAAMTRSRLAEALSATGAYAEAAAEHRAALQLATAVEADGDPVGLRLIRARYDAFFSRVPNASP